MAVPVSQGWQLVFLVSLSFIVVFIIPRYHVLAVLVSMVIEQKIFSDAPAIKLCLASNYYIWTVISKIPKVHPVGTVGLAVTL